MEQQQQQQTTEHKVLRRLVCCCIISVQIYVCFERAQDIHSNKTIHLIETEYI